LKIEELDVDVDVVVMHACIDVCTIHGQLELVMWMRWDPIFVWAGRE
jgi:hypothetical protein